MRIAVAATPDVAIPTLEALQASSHELICVITKPDAPAGRGRELQSSAVAQWAVKNEIPVFKPSSSSEISSYLANIELVITVGFGFMIPENVLKIPKHGFINLHFSLLPRWRGAAPVQRAIEAGDGRTGVTVFKLDQGMDTGPIYTTAECDITPGVNSEELLKSLAILGVGPVLDAIELIAKGELPKEQRDVGATRASKLTKEEGHLDWNTDGAEIQRKIAAFNPNPGAWSIFREQILKINRARLTKVSLPVGKLKFEQRTVIVGTGSYALEILEVTPAGKKTIDAEAWANGARITSEDLLT